MFSLFRRKKDCQEDQKNPQKPVYEDFNNIQPVAQYFQNETGVSFEKQIEILQNKATLFCKQRDIHSFKELLQKLKYAKDIKQDFIDYLTTNETYFYREFKQIQELVSHVKKEKKKVKILCAPSATGEEPYSIAIALLEAGVSSDKFHITGIDINKSAIERAKKAIYKERSIQYLSPDIRDKYFIQQKEHFILKENIKSLVTFKVVNIFDASLQQLGKFDFVFSRNMLIYFDKQTKLKAKKILEDIRSNLKNDVFFGHADLF